MWRCLFLLLPWAMAAGTLEVGVRGSEIWLIADGQPRELTHDGKPKQGAPLSPSRDRVAYVEVCTEQCTPSIVIVDLEGHRVRSLQPRIGAVSPAGPCASVDAITWASDGAIGTDCHINPSLGEYVKTDIATGRNTRDLLGYGFTRSPNGKMVAHVGWIPHFAPPYAQSNYLQMDQTTFIRCPEV